MTTKVITVKIQASKPTKVTFNPPILNPKSIEFVEYYTKLEGYMIYCDCIDPTYSLTNIYEKDPGDCVTVKPSQLLCVFSDTKLYSPLPIQNEKELTNLTLTVKTEDQTPIKFEKNNLVGFKIHCF